MTDDAAGSPVENAMLAALSFDADATAEFASDPRRRLTQSVRHIIDEILTRDDVADDVLEDAADAADVIAASIAGSPHAAVDVTRRTLVGRVEHAAADDRAVDDGPRERRCDRVDRADDR